VLDILKIEKTALI